MPKLAALAILRSQRNRCGGRQPIPTHERDRGGGRNARATSSRSHALPICPPAIHPRESPAAAGPAAIIRQAQKTLTFSLHTLSVRTPPPAIKKRSTLVRKLWTKSLPCGNPRKTETTCPIVPTNAIKMRLGAPCLAAFARRGDFLLHHHNRGCPALRDFRRMGHPGPGRYQTMRLPETQAASSRNPRPSKTAKPGQPQFVWCRHRRKTISRVPASNLIAHARSRALWDKTILPWRGRLQRV